MSLSVVAGRSHSGFRAAVYGIHFDPWDFDTLLYFVKMVAVFCFNGCREFAFLSSQRSPREGLSYIDFLSTSGYLTFAFTPLRESILRLWRAPSLRGYSLGIISHGLSYRRRLTICLLFSQSLRRCAGVLLRGRS